MDDWSELMEANTMRLDPYLVWAVLTGFRDYALAEANTMVAVVIECETNVKDLLGAAKWLSGSIPKLYTDDGVVGPGAARFCTATIPVNRLLDLLRLVRRLELGTAIRTQAPLFTDTRPAPWAPDIVVGVIDDFVAFGNGCFEDDTHTSRVRFVWSQGATVPREGSAVQWYKPKDVGYGYELSSLARQAVQAVPAPDLGQLREAYPAVLRRATHGTHVAHIAAGHDRGGWGLGRCDKDIIAVHLPRRMLADSSGGALSVQALDGLRYIMHRAGPDAAVVVNMSYGTMAGPHDGTSILEQAIDQLISLRDGRLAVVVPAGNAYEERCHARVCLSKTQPRSTLTWNVLPDDSTPSFMEIWLPEAQGISDHVAVRVVSPSGVEVGVAKAPGFAFDTQHSQDSSVGIVYWPKVANGDTGTMILIALAATHSNDAGAPVAAHGIWRVELTYDGDETLEPIEVWIERDDQVHGQPRAGRQSYLIDEFYQMPNQQPLPPDDCDDAQVRRHGALNTIGTGNCAVVVGGYVGVTGKFAAYSGAGPTRACREGPDILAQSEECATQHGLRAAAVEGLDSVRLNGTSVAAPQIARLISKWYGERVNGLPPKLPPAEILRRLTDEAAKYPQEPPPPHDQCREGKGRVLPLVQCGAESPQHGA